MADITPENEVFRLAVATYAPPEPEQRLLEAIRGPVSTPAQKRHKALIGAYAQLSGLTITEATTRVHERAERVADQRGVALDWMLQQVEQAGPETNMNHLLAAAAQETAVTVYAELTRLTPQEAVGQLFRKAGEILERLNRIGSRAMPELPPEIASTIREGLQQAARDEELGRGPQMPG